MSELGDFDIKDVYLKFLQEDSEMTMPVAAIESLLVLLSKTQPSTSSELITVLTDATKKLKSSVRNSISLSAGCDLFLRFVVRNITLYQDWDSCRIHLVENGRLFVERAKAARYKIAGVGLPFIRDGDTILVHGKSRAVSALLIKAAEKFIRFRVYVTESRVTKEGVFMADLLRKHGIPVAVIADSAVGFVINKVGKVFIGAEGVAESGGVINLIGSYQIAVLAKNTNKPLYVLAESHKFVRLFPLSPSDIPTEYPVEFSSDPVSEEEITKQVTQRSPQVDFTPDQYITALITDLGTLTPSGVSEELIKIWFD